MFIAKPEMIDLWVANLFVGLVVAVVTSILTVHLALRRFRQEKLWEKRAGAYERLIEALYHSKAFFNAHMEATMRYQDVPEDREAELQERSAEAHQEIEKAADISAFLLCSEATERVNQYRKDGQTASETTDWDTYLQRKREITDRCLQDMISIAKKDLKTDVGPKNIIKSLSFFRLRG